MESVVSRHPVRSFLMRWAAAPAVFLTIAGRSSWPGAWPPLRGESAPAGTVPNAAVSPVMVAPLAELGIDRSDQVPTRLTGDLLHELARKY